MTLSVNLVTPLNLPARLTPHPRTSRRPRWWPPLGAQKSAKTAQEAPKTAQERSKRAQERSKKAPRRLQSDAREPKTGKDGSKTGHEGSKTAQEGLQGTPKRARKAKIRSWAPTPLSCPNSWDSSSTTYVVADLNILAESYFCQLLAQSYCQLSVGGLLSTVCTACCQQSLQSYCQLSAGLTVNTAICLAVSS